MPLLLLGLPSTIFSNYSFLVHHTVNQDDRHLLAHAIASDFTVTRQFFQREHFFVTDQTPHPEIYIPIWREKEIKRGG
jgi:hypothetical protein